MSPLHEKPLRSAPGLLVSAIVAMAAMFLSERYGAPVMLFALLLGMALNFLSEVDRYRAGLDVAAKLILRTGVALLGLRITLDQVVALGWQPVLMVVVSVVLTIAVGIALARWMGFKAFFGLLTGGAVAICGASAALALSAAMPKHPLKERATLFTVVGVSTLSTLAMMLYPLIVHGLNFSNQDAGFFLGGTIHDVAQVVGAGYSISADTGDTATLIKLLRVAMLVPVIVLASWMTARYRVTQKESEAHAKRPPLLPWFAVAFIVLVGIRSTGVMPTGVIDIGKAASQWCLVVAMAAIGMKTHLKDVVAVGWKPVLLMLMETVFLAILFYGLLRLSSGVGP
ncbi:YeiH family protein [Limnohabitans sp. G3-2]|uniref:YeiH family protein n=1 Tax=Limnohabitans sp. G3-2 TaxID=1100711 RepID=UPI000C1E6939|nr:putative sulfate exporter family transporter [Limnohabitans sp. G3-2]PIT77109.1 hypothetical protein B9Z31_03940 [Limnohabitans sp. G3-2]